jgi:hypothetical protein
MSKHLDTTTEPAPSLLAIWAVVGLVFVVPLILGSAHLVGTYGAAAWRALGLIFGVGLVFGVFWALLMRLRHEHMDRP